MDLRAPSLLRTLLIVGVAALLLILYTSLQANAPAIPPVHQQTDGENVPAIDIASVGLKDVERWMQHLNDGGSVRFEVEGKSDVLAAEVAGLGKLDEEGRKMVRNFMVHMLDNIENTVMRALGSLDEVSKSIEKIALLEAEHSLTALKYGAFLHGLDKGEYFLLADGDDRPPPVEGYSAYNVGARHQGRSVLCVINIKDSDYGLDHARRLVEERRQAWLVSVADRFNRRPDQERLDMLLRRGKFLVEDAKWREENFPEGLRVDPIRSILLVE
jgi:hypothetical protein